MCGGVAVFDFDNDGRLDIFFTNGARIDDPMPDGKKPEGSDPRYSNRLFHQNPDGTFTDVTGKAGLAGTGYSMGVAVGDYDNDGFEDLYVTGLDRATLYHNNGNGTFTDVTAKSGTATGGWSTSAGFFDYDNDGKLDLFVDRYVDWCFAGNVRCADAANRRHYCHPLVFQGTTSILYHNNGDGTFTDVSAKSGISRITGRGPRALRSPTTTTMAGPTFMSPTTPCSPSSSTTTVTGRSPRKELPPGSATTRMEMHLPAWASTSPITTTTACPIWW